VSALFLLEAFTTSIFPTVQAVVGLVSGQERKKRKNWEWFGKLKPKHQWCRYPIPNVVPETDCGSDRKSLSAFFWVEAFTTASFPSWQ